MQVGVIFGNPEITSGGNALKFYASVRLEVRRKETIKGSAGGDDVGIRVKAKARDPPVGGSVAVKGSNTNLGRTFLLLMFHQWRRRWFRIVCCARWMSSHTRD